MPVSIRINPTFLQSISTFETDLPQQRISSLSFIDFSWRRAKCHSLSSRIWPEHRKAPLDVMDSSSIDSLFFFAVLAPKNQDSNSTDMISHALQTFALHDESSLTTASPGCTSFQCHRKGLVWLHIAHPPIWCPTNPWKLHRAHNNICAHVYFQMKRYKILQNYWHLQKCNPKAMLVENFFHWVGLPKSSLCVGYPGYDYLHW